MEDRWERDGVAGEAVSWSVGYGPRTHAYVLKPARAQAPLPGVVALHDHSAFKFYGKEKIADGPADPSPVLTAHRNTYYGGRAYPNTLAREGFVVLVPDAFLWGSRGFPLEVMLDQVGDDTAAVLHDSRPPMIPRPRSPDITPPRPSTSTSRPNTATCWGQPWPAWSRTRTASR